MKQHDPIKLTPTERSDLGSITKHPGLTVLIERIIGGHAEQQLQQIHTVQPDDPDRSTKLDGIGAVAFAMKLTYEMAKREIEFNWKILQEQEEALAKQGKNELEKAQ
jgi:hypothetical protein